MVSPDEYAASMSASLDVYQSMLPRTLQSELGVSSLGHCASEALYLLQQVPASDAPVARQALFGNAAHAMIGAARLAFKPHLLIETEVEATLPSGVRIKGHVDEIDPQEPSVTDYKTVADEADLVALRRTGSSEQQRYQRHVYAYLAIQAGLLPEQGVIVRNVWLDRAGQVSEPYVEQEPFDMAVVHAADRWLEGVRYAAEHGEEAPRDKHHDWCKRFCQFFTHCRQGTAHADYTVTDPDMVAAAAMLAEGRAKSKEGGNLETAAKRVLAPLQESAQGEVAAFVAGDHRVRWQWINTAAGGHWKCLVDRLEPVSA